ncbi:MAG TPA: hypothetical protein VJ785_00410 [Anaerolineales bacterium]|nr:hypothetical protein [Anaerolineales bacterium]
MRRIIERVVTVVTTTTWKISWEADPHPSQPKADPVTEELPPLGVLPESMPRGPTVIETREVDPPEIQNGLNLPTEELPDDPNSYPLKKGKEKS